MQNTKSGVVAALIHRGFFQHEGPFPPHLKTITPAPSFTQGELEWADYIIADTDFGGAWNDATQLDMHLA